MSKEIEKVMVVKGKGVKIVDGNSIEYTVLHFRVSKLKREKVKGEEKLGDLQVGFDISFQIL